MSNASHILLVDDDRQVVQYLKTALEEGGYTVEATTSGTQALVSMQASAPDLLILDLNMPAPDGFDLLKTLRKQYPYLRVMVISGYLKGALLEAASHLGAIATLQKPVNAETLLAKVGEVIGGHRKVV
jgi:CheY-like chemotaxis protein